MSDPQDHHPPQPSLPPHHHSLINILVAESHTFTHRHPEIGWDHEGVLIHHLNRPNSLSFLFFLFEFCTLLYCSGEGGGWFLFPFFGSLPLPGPAAWGSVQKSSGHQPVITKWIHFWTDGSMNGWILNKRDRPLAQSPPRLLNCHCVCSRATNKKKKRMAPCRWQAGKGSRFKGGSHFVVSQKFLRLEMPKTGAISSPFFVLMN